MHRFLPLFIYLFPCILHAQDPSFSQIDNTYSYVHPSFIEVKDGSEFQLVTRDQWFGIANHFVTNFFSGNWQFYLPNDHARKNLNIGPSGIGFTVLYNDEGVGGLSTIDVNMILRQRFYFSSENQKCNDDNNTVTIAFDFGWFWENINRNYLVFSDQIDPINGVTLSSSSPIYNEIGESNNSDAAVSLTGSFSGSDDWATKVAFTIHHILSSQESLINTEINTGYTYLPLNVALTVITNWHPITHDRGIMFRPMGQWETQNFPLIRMNQADLNRFVLGTAIGYAGQETEKVPILFGGLYYSFNTGQGYDNNANAIIPEVGLSLGGEWRYKFAISYDLYINGTPSFDGYSGHPGGAVECTLKITHEKCSAVIKDKSFQYCDTKW